jgi:glycosyltransferase involved in cell wall biosynthesis
LAEAMAKLAADPGLRAEMGAAGRADVAARFTRRKMAEAHIALYERILAGRR